jgi:hypothetical protein
MSTRQKQLLILTVIVYFVILCTVFTGCDSAGLGAPDNTSDAGDSENPADEPEEEAPENQDPEEPQDIAVLSVLNPPAAGTLLPEISETVSHTLSYTISDDYYTPGNTYRITGYFRASDSIIQVYQTTVSDQSDNSVAVSFNIPAGFPVISTTVTPYRLFYQLTDETSGILVLDDSSDCIYEDWIFTGTWYGIDSKSEVSNMDFQVWEYDTDSGYENGRKGPLENKPGNSAYLTYTYIWNEEESMWDEPPNPEQGTIYYSFDGEIITYANDSSFTNIFQLLSTEPTTYDEDYAGKWWTGDVKLDGSDNGIIIYMSDKQFEILRDEQTNYPLVERGTVSASGSTITLTVTHLPSGTPGYFTAVDPNDPIVEYTMTYSYSAGADTLTFTGTEGGDYADADGIEYSSQ